MSETEVHCTAVTKSGTPCKNKPLSGTDKCRIHTAKPETTTKPTDQPPAHDPTPEQQAQFHHLVSQLNDIAQKLQSMAPSYTPPPFSAQELGRLLKENLHRFSPEVRLDILKQLQEGWPGPSAKDLLDIETWKGLWFILNYSVQTESQSVLGTVTGHLANLPGVGLLKSLPGASLVTDLQGMLQGTTPKDFLDVDTWKGMWYIVNYSLQYEAGEMKKRLLGESEEELEDETE